MVVVSGIFIVELHQIRWFEEVVSRWKLLHRHPVYHKFQLVNVGTFPLTESCFVSLRSPAGNFETMVNTRVAQVSNVSAAATMEQLRTLFGFLGKIEDIRLFPKE